MGLTPCSSAAARAPLLPASRAGRSTVWKWSKSSGSKGTALSEPHPAGRGPPVAQGAVDGVDQGLAAVLEAGAAALFVHRVAEGDARSRVGEAQGTAGAEMAERLLGEDHAVILGRRETVVVDALHEPVGPPS